MSGNIEFPIPHEEYAGIARRQKERASRIAGQLECGALLVPDDARFAAKILRTWAANLPEARARKPGQAQQVDHFSVALDFASRVQLDGVTKHKAIADVAEAYGVTVEAIRKIVKKHGKQAEQSIGIGTSFLTEHPKGKGPT